MNAIKLDVLINALTVMDYQTNINYTNLIVWSVYQHSDKKCSVPSFLGWNLAVDCLGRPACCCLTLSPLSLMFPVKTKTVVGAQTHIHTVNSLLFHFTASHPFLISTDVNLRHSNLLHQPKLNGTQLNTMQRRCQTRLLTAVLND